MGGHKTILPKAVQKQRREEKKTKEDGGVLPKPQKKAPTKQNNKGIHDDILYDEGSKAVRAREQRLMGSMADDDEEDEEDFKRARPGVLDLASDSEEDDYADEDDDVLGSSKYKSKDYDAADFGKSKYSYYDGNDLDDMDQSSDEDIAKEEEKEAQRLQKEKLKRIAEDDFEDAFSSMVASKEGVAPKSKSEEKSSKKQSKSSKKSALDSAENIAVERVEKDVSKLSKEDKLQIILAESPELLELLEDFKQKVNEIRTHAGPLLSKVQDGKLATKDGISYLEVKLHLLLTYCTDLAFYFLLKSTGKSVKDHPVIMQLVQIRTILEKLQPLDQKLRYQVDKLLQLATSDSASKLQPERAAASSSLSSAAGRFKPNPSALVSAQDEADEDGSGVYRAPKLAAVPYLEEEKDAAKSKKQREKLVQQARRSNMIRALQTELSDAPEEMPNIGADADAEDEFSEAAQLQRHQDEYEEDMYTRLSLTKQDKQKLKRKQKVVLDELDMLDGIGDLDAIDQAYAVHQEEEDLATTKRRKLAEFLSAEESKKGKKISKDQVEEAVASAFSGETFSDLSEDEDEAQEKKLSAKKARKEEDRQKRKTEDAEREEQRRLNMPPPMAEDDEEESKYIGGKRLATREIVNNKGIVMKRSKEQSRPRLAMRKSFNKASQKHKSSHRGMRTAGDHYDGERNINKQTSRSVVFK